MSDVPGGPGWWMASDHKWYPPELYERRTKPDESGRAGPPPRVVIPAEQSTLDRYRLVIIGAAFTIAVGLLVVIVLVIL